MRGMVLGFDPVSGEGVVNDESGARYGFDTSAWRGRSLPVAGETIDFEARDGRAFDVFPLPGAAQATGPGAALRSDPDRQAMLWGGLSIGFALLSAVLPVAGLFTSGFAIFFGLKAKRMKPQLTEKAGYFMGLAGLVLGFLTLFAQLSVMGCVALLGMGR
jgi:hypothetical protein